MAEYCGTAALANAVVISWSRFPSSSAFEDPALRHNPLDQQARELKEKFLAQLDGTPDKASRR
jgi:hypothetical protein